ncbi:LysR family transcriptional regulator [Variovorax saccharolyticus]|uniref:LysR family transcriptional regulator n=1 Tax=Variovorax saccharolyticus TaxID=3053516 RepID=UPI002576DFAB|nr:LysR family transcriptional regulator [Variovorax sp. J22R187]MDM0018942.1 LysR family transcriptional regulator [Variovorax sp. J22R187]
MNITLQQLRIFREVARRQSFSLAGHRIGLTQPAVSRAVVELEALLAVKLLSRTTREVKLTDAGEKLVAQLDRILDDLDETLRRVSEASSVRSGKVRIGGCPVLSAALLPLCVATCAVDSPDIRISFRERGQDEAMESVVRGEVDFGIAINPGLRDDLESEVVGSDPFLLVTQRHRQRPHRSAHWSSLDGEALVLLDDTAGSSEAIARTLLQHGVKAHVRQVLPHAATLLKLLGNGNLAGVTTALAQLPYNTDGFLMQALSPPVERSIALVRSRGRALSPAADHVWETLRGVAEKLHEVSAPSHAS